MQNSCVCKRIALLPSGCSDLISRADALKRIDTVHTYKFTFSRKENSPDNNSAVSWTHSTAAGAVFFMGSSSSKRPPLGYWLSGPRGAIKDLGQLWGSFPSFRSGRSARRWRRRRVNRSSTQKSRLPLWGPGTPRPELPPQNFINLFMGCVMRDANTHEACS